jgi:hypothetical protein
MRFAQRSPYCKDNRENRRQNDPGGYPWSWSGGTTIASGLTAAYELSNLGVECVVLEQDAVVGGLARTVEYRGFRFDIGGHRFAVAH